MNFMKKKIYIEVNMNLLKKNPKSSTNVKIYLFFL